jgi:hypothetical protein
VSLALFFAIDGVQGLPLVLKEVLISVAVTALTADGNRSQQE